jgi:hypothetical protein
VAPRRQGQQFSLYMQVAAVKQIKIDLTDHCRGMARARFCVLRAAELHKVIDTALFATTAGSAKAITGWPSSITRRG